jgi:hypothetical protein
MADEAVGSVDIEAIDADHLDWRLVEQWFRMVPAAGGQSSTRRCLPDVQIAPSSWCVFAVR